MFGVQFTLRLALALLLLSLVSVNVSKRALPLAVSNKRIQLLEDALGWMNFRKNGQLMSKEQLKPLFTDILKKRYMLIRFFRTFVIAFEHGVLPRLTLNENEECDLGYTWQYKDPFSGTATWHFMKDFTFKNYKERDSSTHQFCDYRQGLICKPATSKCGCPEGSKMQEISPGSPVKRCLLEENEICSLIDLDHGDDPNHKALVFKVYQIIFNLEKPLSCKHGTQCRFKSPDITFPRCYKVNGGPWAPPYVDKFGNTMDTWKLGFGDECVLGLIASPGSCARVQWMSSDSVGTLSGYTCFNYGPRRSKISSIAVAENRTGFCAHDYGPYGITTGYSELEPDSSQKTWITLFSPFVTPRTVPLRGRELEAFFREYIKVPDYFHSDTRLLIQQSSEGAKCSVKKTEMWEQTWSYFASLENDPPPGQDYVPQATKTELYANLQRVIGMTKNTKQKVCRIYGPYDSAIDVTIYGVIREKDRKPTLRCWRRYWTDQDGNDGTCQTPGNLDTKAFDSRFEIFRHHIKHVEHEDAGEQWNHDQGILIDYPDGVCLPSLEPLPKGRYLGDVLEGGFCEDGYVCYKDYSEFGNKYDENCNLRSSKELIHVCHYSKDDEEYSKCEALWQDKAMSKELERMGDANLNRGEKCAYDIEKSIRDKIGSTMNQESSWSESEQEHTKTNKYKVLHWLEKTRLSGGLDGGLCDRTKLLECNNQTGSCECVDKTQPRRFTIDGVEYLSDYCYVAEGNCDMDPTETREEDWRDRTPLPLTELEKDGLWKHYGKSSNWCDNTNLCVALRNEYGRECTTDSSSGLTGYDLKPDPPTTPTTTLKPATTRKWKPGTDYVESEEGSTGRPGWRKGGSCSLRINKRLTGSLLITMFIYTAYFN